VPCVEINLTLLLLIEGHEGIIVNKILGTGHDTHVFVRGKNGEVYVFNAVLLKLSAEFFKAAESAGKIYLIATVLFACRKVLSDRKNISVKLLAVLRLEEDDLVIDLKLIIVSDVIALSLPIRVFKLLHSFFNVETHEIMPPMPNRN
jgi:hypothetical protein